MGKFILKRVGVLIPTLFLMSVFVFLIIHLIPGDPVQGLLGQYATPDAVDAMREALGLNKPLLEQYFSWIGGIFRGDWGTSLMNFKPVLPAITERLPKTLLLCATSVVLSVIIAIPLGILSARKNNTLTDLSISTGSLLFISIPGFWFGILLMLLFSVKLGWLPAGGYVAPDKDFAGFIRCLILPVVVLAATLAASTVRLLRSSMLEVMNEDYVMLARVKGASSRRVLYVHALRNALGPIFSTISMQIAFLMGGTLIIERVFQFPGMGLVLLTAVEQRDYPLVKCGIMIFATIVMVVYLLTDIVYAYIDPKVRYK